MLPALLIWAQKTIDPMLLMGGMLLLFFIFLVILPKRRQEREKMEMLRQLDKNDKVQTIGGIFGTIVSNNEQEEYVTIKIDDKVNMKILRGAVHRNISKEEARAAAKAEAKTT